MFARAQTVTFAASSVALGPVPAPKTLKAANDQPGAAVLSVLVKRRKRFARRLNH
jgi:hypothetical protein